MWFIWTIVEQCSSSNEGEINDSKLVFPFLKSNFIEQQEKTNFERNCKLHFLPRVFCQLEFHFSCRLYLLLAPPDDVSSKIADLGHYFKCQEKN